MAFSPQGFGDNVDGLNPMISYYAEQAAAHALRNPQDPTAQQQAHFWAAKLQMQRHAQAQAQQASWAQSSQQAPQAFQPSAPQQASAFQPSAPHQAPTVPPLFGPTASSLNPTPPSTHVTQADPTVISHSAVHHGSWERAAMASGIPTPPIATPLAHTGGISVETKYSKS